MNPRWYKTVQDEKTKVEHTTGKLVLIVVGGIIAALFVGIYGSTAIEWWLSR
jgi:hypothetical protein